MTLHSARYDDDDAYYYVVNNADRDIGLNSVAGSPEIIKELRKGTIEIILRRARSGADRVVKFAVGSGTLSGTVRGYATFFSFVTGCDLVQLEARLGMRSGVLQKAGVYMYNVDALALNSSNIAPRGNTDWSAGVSPRDLHNLSGKTGSTVGYHRNYPAATQPIIQFAILSPVPFLGQPRFLKLGDSV